MLQTDHTARIVGATKPISGDGDVEKLTGDLTSAASQGLDQMSKMEKVVLKMAHRRGSDAEQFASSARSILLFPPAWVRRIKCGCNSGIEDEKVHSK